MFEYKVLSFTDTHRHTHTRIEKEWTGITVDMAHTATNFGCAMSTGPLWNS